MDAQRTGYASAVTDSSRRRGCAARARDRRRRSGGDHLARRRGSQRYIVVLKGNASATQVLQDAKLTAPRRSARTATPFRVIRRTCRPKPRAAPRRTRTSPWSFLTAPPFDVAREVPHPKVGAGRSATTINRRDSPTSTTPSSYRPLLNGCSFRTPGWPRVKVARPAWTCRERRYRGH